MSDNEKFLTMTTIEVSNGLNLNAMQKQELKEMLYKCLRNYNISEIECEESSFMEMVEIYLSVKKMEGYSKSTLQNRFYALRELDSFIKKKYSDVTISDFRMYISHKQDKGTKATTINTIIHHIKTFFNWLVEEEYIHKNPTIKLKELKEPIRLPKSLNTIDLERIRLACKNDRDRAIVEFAFSTGLRVSEITECNIKDLDMSKKSLLVIGKGDKEREVYFSDKAKFYLEKYLESRKGNDISLFTSSKKPYGRISKRTLQRIVENVKNNSEVSANVTPHVFRHTMATRLVNSGADVTTVQHILGHSKLETSLLYMKISRDRVKYQYMKGLDF